MSQRIRLWIDGVETEPMEESEVRDKVVRGQIPNTTLARPDDSAGSDWQAVGTVLADADRQDPVSESIEDERRAKRRIRTAVLVTFTTLAIAFVWWASSGPVRWSAAPSRTDAYRSARQFALDRLPGAKHVAPESEAIIEREGQTFRVAFRVDGLNAFGGPVRRDVAVEMRHDGGSFAFVRLKQ